MHPIKLFYITFDKDSDVTYIRKFFDEQNDCKAEPEVITAGENLRLVAG